jgi:hypothetical protein
MLPPDAGPPTATTTKRCFLVDKGFDDKHGIACGDVVIQKIYWGRHKRLRVGNGYSGGIQQFRDLGKGSLFILQAICGDMKNKIEYG